MADFLIDLAVCAGRWFADEVVYAVLALVVPEKHRAAARRASVLMALLAALALCLACSALTLWPGV